MRAGTQPDAPSAEPTTDRILTVPNALSLLRLLGVPLFLWLVLEEHDGWAVAVLMVSGFTDWLDGKIARSWNQMSKIGASAFYPNCATPARR